MLTHTHSLTHINAHARARTHTHSHSHTRTHTRMLTHSHHTHTHTLSLSHTYTRVHTRTHTHTRSLTKLRYSFAAVHETRKARLYDSVSVKVNLSVFSRSNIITKSSAELGLVWTGTSHRAVNHPTVPLPAHLCGTTGALSQHAVRPQDLLARAQSGVVLLEYDSCGETNTNN